MADLFDFTDDELDDENIPIGIRNAARAARDNATTSAETARELMFLRAGVDVKSTDPRHAKLATMLFKTWTGDETALKAEALDLGLVTAPASTQAADEAAQAEQLRQQLGGGEPAGGHEDLGPNPTDNALIQFQSEVQKGQPREEAAHKALASMFIAGAKGDQRVIFDQHAHRQRALELEGAN